jgi:hypothetical protein
MLTTIIRQWMQDNDLTHQELADRIGYNRVSVTRALRREEAPAQFWKRFSDAFPEGAAEILMEMF